jgi:hypothetical protein
MNGFRPKALTFGVLFVVCVATFASGAGAVVQAAFGTAHGTIEVTFGPSTVQHDSGTYLSLRQLGSGHYDFVSTVSACDDATGFQTLSGIATLVRSDGATLKGTLIGNEACFTNAPLSVLFSLNLTSGTRDLVHANIDFFGTFSGMTLTPGGERGTETLTAAGSLGTTTRIGWWALGVSGDVYSFGGAANFGSAQTQGVAATRLEPTPSHNGYWIVNELGQVYAFGDARWFGNADRRTWFGVAIPETVVSLISTASGNGYWLVTSKGRVVPFGDAQRLGQVYPGPMAAHVVAAVATPSRQGYYLVGSDGGVFSYGDAKFHGSTGALHLNAPIVGMAVSPTGHGYWLVASDGGVFAFGVPFAGSLGHRSLLAPIVAATPYGSGYALVDINGDVFNFSDQPFFGSAASNALTIPPIAGLTAIG